MLEPLPYEPITFYDAPGIALEQLLSGRLSPRLLRDLVFDPDALSPLERRDLGNRLYSPVAGEGNAAMRAVTGVVTNPFVWMYLLTSPVGAKALSSGGSLFTLARKFAPQMKRASAFFGFADTALEMTDGSAGPALIQHVNGRMVQGAEASSQMMAPARANLMAAMEKNWKLGPIHSLNPEDYKAGDPRAKKLRKWAITSDAVLHDQVVDLPYYGKPLDPKRKRLISTPVILQDKSVVQDLSEQLKGTTIEEQARGAYALTAEARESVKEYNDALRKQWRQVQRRRDRMALKGVRDFSSLENSDLLRFSTEQELLNKRGQYVGQQRRMVFDQIEPEKQSFDSKMVRDHLLPLGKAQGEYLNALTLDRKRNFIEAIGDEAHYKATGEYRPDRDKIVNLVGSFRKYADGMQSNASGYVGLEALINATSLEFMESLGKQVAVQAGRVPGHMDDLYRLVEEVIDPGETWGRRWWAPRALYESQPVMAGGKRIRPVAANTADGAKAHEYTPFARVLAGDEGASRLAPLTGKPLEIHVDDLEEMYEYLTPHGHDMLRRARKGAQDVYGKKQGIRMGLRLDPERSHEKYTHSMTTLRVMDIEPVPESVLQADTDTLGNLAPEVRKAPAYLANGARVERGDDLMAFDPSVRKQFTARFGMNRVVQGELSPVRKAQVATNLGSSALSMAGPEYMAIYNAQMRSKEIAHWFGNSWLGRQVEKMGPWGKDLVAGVREFGDFSKGLRNEQLTGGLANWLYTTHLGINLSSVVLNLTQPLLLAASVGKPSEVLKAYGRAIGQMGEYAKKRMALGKVFIDDATKTRLIRESFPLADFDVGNGVRRNLLGIGPKQADFLDSRLQNAGRGFLSKSQEVLLKGFEVSERFNRVVVGELMHSIHMGRYGKLGTHFASDTQRMILQTQFAAMEANTPQIFRQGPLANPLARMFMSFPLRSFTNVVRVFPKLGGEDNYWRGLFNTVMRGMATSALVYEVGKGLTGADLSRGLFLSASTDLLGGERLLRDGNDWVPVPPIIDIPLDALRATAAGDMQLMGDTLARVVPGGVAIARLLGAAPEAGRGIAGLPGSLQKTYVGWDQPLPDGTVPVYSGDGRLINYESPSAVVMRALGADLGAHRDQAGLDSYLVKQREEIVQQRQELLRAIGSNDMRRAQQVQSAFMTRFGYPLTVSQDQIRNYLRNQTVGRSERILDRTDAPARGALGAMAREGTGVRGGLGAGATARQRDPFRQRGIDERRLRDLEERVREVGRGATQDTGAFGGFGGFR